VHMCELGQRCQVWRHGQISDDCTASAKVNVVTAKPIPHLPQPERNSGGRGGPGTGDNVCHLPNESVDMGGVRRDIALVNFASEFREGFAVRALLGGRPFAHVARDVLGDHVATGAPPCDSAHVRGDDMDLLHAGSVLRRCRRRYKGDLLAKDVDRLQGGHRAHRPRATESSAAASISGRDAEYNAALPLVSRPCRRGAEDRQERLDDLQRGEVGRLQVRQVTRLK
jgi:hypothetical protein